MGFFSLETCRTVDLKQSPVIRQVDAYMKWGVQEVWLIYPETRTLFVHSRGSIQQLSEGAFLTSSLIPGWQLQIVDLFENL